MMRMWFMEFRADFVDKTKNDVIDQYLKNVAAEVHATGTLLMDGARIDILLYSDDMMVGRRQLEWLAAKKAVVIQESSDPSRPDGLTATVTEDLEQTPVSDEMVEALAQLRKLKSED